MLLDGFLPGALLDLLTQRSDDLDSLLSDLVVQTGFDVVQVGEHLREGREVLRGDLVERVQVLLVAQAFEGQHPVGEQSASILLPIQGDLIDPAEQLFRAAAGVPL